MVVIATYKQFLAPKDITHHTLHITVTNLWNYRASSLVLLI